MKILQKSLFSKSAKNAQKLAEPKNFFLHILIPWVLRNTRRGGDHHILKKGKITAPKCTMYFSLPYMLPPQLVSAVWTLTAGKFE